MQTIQKQYSISFSISLALHLVLIALFIFTIQLPSHLPKVVKKGNTVKIVHATAVNQQAVENAVKKLKQRQTDKKRAEADYAKSMQEKAEKAKHERRIQDEKLAKDRKDAEEVKRQQAEHTKKVKAELARIKAQKIAEQKQLDTIKQQNASQQKKHHQALAKEKQAEAKLAQLKKQQATKTKQQKAQQALLAKQLAQEKKQMAAQKAQYINGVIDKYVAMITNQIESHWNVNKDVNRNLTCQVQIQLAPSGKVLSVVLVKSSGNAILDRSAISAVYQASPLPVPKNPTIFAKFKQFSIKMTPGDVLNG